MQARPVKEVAKDVEGVVGVIEGSVEAYGQEDGIEAEITAEALTGIEGIDDAEMISVMLVGVLYN